MDFNLKSKLWAGNIYHQFESICHDVDEFVNKDTVKFVGNQVQNVGISVKRLYSNVVQDVLPLSVKPERQPGEQGDMQNRVSVTGVRTTSTHSDEKQLPNNQVSDGHKMQISKPANTPESQTCQYFRNNVDAIVQNNEDNNSDAEKSVTRDLKSVTDNSSFDSEIFSRKCDEDYISSSPVFSADGEGSTSIEKEIRDFNHQKVDKGFSDDMGFYETSSNGWLSKSMLSVFEDPYFDENGSLSSPPLPVSTHKVNVDNCPPIDSPLPPACDVDDWALEKDRVLGGNCYTKHESVDLSTSDQSSEQPLSYHSYNEKEQIVIMPSTYCASPKSPITVESTSADFSKKVENVLHTRSVSDSISAASTINDADTTNEAASADSSKKAENVLHSRSVSDGCTYNISAASSINAADTTKALDVEPFFPILESYDINAR